MLEVMRFTTSWEMMRDDLVALDGVTLGFVVVWFLARKLASYWAAPPPFPFVACRRVSPA